MDNIDLEFTDDALVEIAKAANKENTGARGLRAIIEGLMLDVMYEIPNLKNVKRCIVNSDCFTKKSKPIIEFEKKAG